VYSCQILYKKLCEVGIITILTRLKKSCKHVKNMIMFDLPKENFHGGDV